VRWLAALFAIGFSSTAAAQTGASDALLAPALSAWIVDARDAAVERGVAPIPREIRAVLAGYVPDTILDGVRWRVDDTEVSVQQTLFSLGYTPAVTLDYVIVFAVAEDASSDPALWAHALSRNAISRMGRRGVRRALPRGLRRRRARRGGVPLAVDEGHRTRPCALTRSNPIYAARRED
jgi:hypothetical protein